MVPFLPQASIVDPDKVQTHKQIGWEKFLDRTDILGDLKGKRAKRCAVFNLLVDPKDREFELED